MASIFGFYATVTVSFVHIIVLLLSIPSRLLFGSIAYIDILVLSILFNPVNYLVLLVPDILLQHMSSLYNFCSYLVM